MIRILMFLMLINVAFLVSCTSDSNTELQKLWETQDVFMTPESVAYDSLQNCLYVSNFNDKGGYRQNEDTLNDECISKIDPEGNIIEFRWIDNLLGPTGVAILKDTLYVVERGRLAKISISEREIKKRIAIEDYGFPNDLAVDENGIVYISDSQKGCIYQVKDNQCTLWFNDSLIIGANGLLIQNDLLIVGNKGENNLISISIPEKKITSQVPVSLNNIDGIKEYKDGYIVSWLTEILTVDQNGHSKLLLETKNEENADFEFLPEENIIIVPMLAANKVIAYKIIDNQ